MRAILISLLVLTAPGTAAAQGNIYIRGLRYTDMSGGSRVDTPVVAPGGTIRVTLPRSFGSYLRAEMSLEDVNRPSGASGLTHITLRRRRLSGNRMLAAAPALPVFVNRTYNVAVFVFVDGVTRYYASAGRVRIGTPTAANNGSGIRRPPTRSIPPRRNLPRPTPAHNRVPRPVSRGTAVYIRGLRYMDMTRGTTIANRSVVMGGRLVIRLPRRFGRVQRTEVVLEDAYRRRNSSGVTNFALRRRGLRGNVVQAIVPRGRIYSNRVFKVSVFVFVNGQRRFYANAGQIRLVPRAPVARRSPPIRYRYPNSRYPSRLRTPTNVRVR